MSERQREETVVVQKWQEELSEDSQREGRKENKNESFSVVHTSVFTKPESIAKKYIATPRTKTVMSPTFLLQSGFL